MGSKQVMDRERSDNSVVAVGDAHAAEVGTALNKLAKPHLKKGENIDFDIVVRVLGRMLAGAKQHMVEADNAHQAELDDDVPVREERDTAVIALSDHLVSLREILIGAFGNATAAKVFNGATPEEPVALSRYAGEVAKKLESIKLPTSRIPGSKIDAGAIAGSIRQKKSALDDAFQAVQREVREAQGTLTKKNDAIADNDRMFAGVATTFTGLLTLAGKADLAGKVRPPTRRAGVIAEEGDSTDGLGPSAQPATPAGPSADSNAPPA